MPHRSPRARSPAYTRAALACQCARAHARGLGAPSRDTGRPHARPCRATRAQHRRPRHSTACEGRRQPEASHRLATRTQARCCRTAPPARGVASPAFASPPLVVDAPPVPHNARAIASPGRAAPTPLAPLQSVPRRAPPHPCLHRLSRPIKRASAQLSATTTISTTARPFPKSAAPPPRP